MDYWIDIETPAGTISLWNNRAPTEAFRIAKSLGYRVAYGREGETASRSWPKDYPGQQ